MTKEENIRAILECNFAGFKDENIDTAVSRIMELDGEPCEDCISRTAVLDLMKKKWVEENEVIKSDDIKRLPSIQPEIKTGHWINGDSICPCCGESKFKDLDADIWADWQPNYCPNCGAKMVEPRESEK